VSFDTLFRDTKILMTAEQKKEQKIRLLKAKVAVALQDELGRVPKRKKLSKSH
jgi:hypothetical protein